MPREIDAYLDALLADQILRGDFPQVELAGLKWSQGGLSTLPQASFTVELPAEVQQGRRQAHRQAEVELTVCPGRLLPAPEGRRIIAQGFSPGFEDMNRKDKLSPGGATEVRRATWFPSPLRGSVWVFPASRDLPRAEALGYYLPPLRG